MSDSRLVTVADHPSAVDPEPFAGPDHPMRRITRDVAAGRGWTPERAAKVAALFDSMAADWAEDDVAPRKATPVVDAVERGGVPTDGTWLELGSGTGAGIRSLVTHVDRLVCVDLAMEMLRHAPDLAPRVCADSARLPFADDRFSAVLCVNMLLFPDEVDRVLGPDGVVVWVNSLGDQTPIHLPPADVLDALPGDWSGTTARAGSGFWLVARRA